MRKYLIITFVAALALFFASDAVAKKNNIPQISLTQQSYDFGTIPEHGGKVSHDFIFENAGGGVLIIKDAKADCGCTVPEYPKNPIAPGKKGKIRVTYNPLHRPGGFSKTITITTNGKPRKVRLRITGSVNPNK